MRQFRTLSLTAVLALVLLALAEHDKQHLARADDDDPGRNGGFGSRIAGTYVAYPDGSNLQVLQLHVDGTVSGTDGNNYEGASGGNYGSPFFGSWARTGPREITAVATEIGSSADGVFSFVARVRASIVFDRDIHGFSALGPIEVFTPGQDLLDPRAEPLATFFLSYQARRMPVK